MSCQDVHHVNFGKRSTKFNEISQICIAYSNLRDSIFFILIIGPIKEQKKIY